MTKPHTRMGDRTTPLRRAIASDEGGRGKSFAPVTITLPSVGGTYTFVDGKLIRDGVRQDGRAS